MAPRRERSDEELLADAKQRGVQPARADVAPLIARLAVCEEDVAEAIERLLARLGTGAARAARERLGEARPPQRGRLVRLIGRVAQETGDAELSQFLVGALEDADDKSRRNAVIALGKLGAPEPKIEVERALTAAWAREGSLPIRRSIAAALGKIGGPDSLALLRAVETDDAELERIAGEARLKLERTLGRPERARLDATRAIPREAGEVWLRCRQGLEQLVCDELGPAAKPRVIAAGLVEARASGPLQNLYRSRIALRFGFPLPVESAASLEQAVVGALASPRALAIMRAFTDGRPRYRLEWASGGHRRGLTFRVAQAVAARRPELVNDPTASEWEAVVTEERDGPSVELWPRGLDDPRFAYRVEQVPASSHPTLAAALARIGGVRPDDVVWDPFVGSGTELVERARLGPFKRLIGTDRDARAVERARKNLEAAGVEATLAVDDAEEHDPGPVTLIITNPPMGRRVLNKTLTGGLLHNFLRRVPSLLARGGRLVWISPRAADTAAQAEDVGLPLTFRQRVDMGGFWAELQAFTRR